MKCQYSVAVASRTSRYWSFISRHSIVNCFASDT